jgi:hemerythrin-like metal-binding protein
MTVNPIKWSDEFSVGIESIDEQHKKLVNMIKTLYDALREGRASEVVDEILNGLFDYADYHFSYEEELFDKYGYPDARNHKEEHEELGHHLKQLSVKLEIGDCFMGEILLLEFLEDWLIKHIMTTDKKFGPFFIEKGVK